MTTPFDSRRSALRCLLACAFAAVGPPAAAGQPRPATNAIGWEGERVAVSLRGLERALAGLHAARKPVPPDLEQLGGGNWPEGFIEEGGDLILIFQRQPQREPMHLDELLVLYRNVLLRSRGSGGAPHCSLDPQPESLRAVERVSATRVDISQPGHAERFAAALEKAWNAKGQQVLVGGAGVARESLSAHRCIVADYDMKKHVQASSKSEGLDGVPSLIDRLLDEARGPSGNAAAGPSMARFWFRISDYDRQPSFTVTGNTVTLDKLDVAVFTERQVVNRDGRTRDAGGGNHPLMLAMAADLSRFMSAHPQGSYGSLDQSYRLLALLQAAAFRRSVDSAQLPFIAQHQPEIARRPMPAALPGLVNYKLLRRESRSGDTITTRLDFPLVMGGGDMDMKIEADKFSSTRTAPPTMTTALRRLRPTGSVPLRVDAPAYWIY